MKFRLYFCALFLIFTFLNLASYGEPLPEGCFPKYLYMVNGKPIYDKDICDKQNPIYSCWVESTNPETPTACYWVGNPSQCTCIRQGGIACNGTLGNGAQFGYCLWTTGGDRTGCDAWQLEREVCTAPGYKIDAVPPTVEVLCTLRGGTVNKNRKMCENFYSNQDQRMTCSLVDLWDGKCGFKTEVYKPKK